jgi:formiminoglutamase
VQHPHYETLSGFKGGYTTRHYGRPQQGVHALQMELACRAYMREPRSVDARNWPTPYEPAYAASTRGLLEKIFLTILAWIA